MSHNLKIIGHAPGLAFGLLLRARVNWALGRVLVNLLLGLLWLLLGLRSHLVHNLVRGVYTYEKMSCNMRIACNNTL